MIGLIIAVGVIAAVLSAIGAWWIACQAVRRAIRSGRVTRE